MTFDQNYWSMQRVSELHSICLKTTISATIILFIKWRLGWRQRVRWEVTYVSAQLDRNTCWGETGAGAGMCFENSKSVSFCSFNGKLIHFCCAMICIWTCIKSSLWNVNVCVNVPWVKGKGLRSGIREMQCNSQESNLWSPCGKHAERNIIFIFQAAYLDNWNQDDELAYLPSNLSTKRGFFDMNQEPYGCWHLFNWKGNCWLTCWLTYHLENTFPRPEMYLYLLEPGISASK